jgi:CspA family cold shock protein
MYSIIEMTTSGPVVTNARETSTSELLTGRVKWFNNKAGYGFISVNDGAQPGTDIFVHHSAINVSNKQYKYLVPGEYVEFKTAPTKDSSHEVQAADVSGIKGGKLMCETRYEFRVARNSHKDGESQDDEPAPVLKAPRSVRVPTEDGVKSGASEWKFVKPTRSRSAEAPSQKPKTGKPRGRPAASSD